MSTTVEALNKNIAEYKRVTNSMLEEKCARIAELEREHQNALKHCGIAVKRIAELEAQLESTVHERDGLENVVEKMMEAVGLSNGHDYEWSSEFGYGEAIEMVEEKIASEKSAHLATQRALVDMYRLVVSVDTGAQQDVAGANWYDARSGYLIAYRSAITAARAAVAQADGKEAV